MIDCGADHRLEPKNHANCEAERRYTHTYSRSELQAVICERLRMTATAPLASTGSAMREGVRAGAGAPRLENMHSGARVALLRQRHGNFDLRQQNLH